MHMKILGTWKYASRPTPQYFHTGIHQQGLIVGIRGFPSPQADTRLFDAAKPLPSGTFTLKRDPPKSGGALWLVSEAEDTNRCLVLGYGYRKMLVQGNGTTGTILAYLEEESRDSYDDYEECQYVVLLNVGECIVLRERSELTVHHLLPSTT